VQECSGHGTCLAMSKTCLCFPGYTGSHCNECAQGFSMFEYGVCEPKNDVCSFAPSSPTLNQTHDFNGYPGLPYPKPAYPSSSGLGYPGNGTAYPDTAVGGSGCGAHDACSYHGNCIHNQCQCLQGFFGRECAESGCPVTWSHDQCKCCPSGVISAHGVCCMDNDTKLNFPRPLLDKDGNCCYSAHVDACGICGGNGFYTDQSGTCCQVLSTSSYSLSSSHCAPPWVLRRH
jgi:hypothetical protein